MTEKYEYCITVPRTFVHDGGKKKEALRANDYIPF